MSNILCKILVTILLVFCVSPYASELIPPQLKQQVDKLSSLIRDPHAYEDSRKIYLLSSSYSGSGAIVVLDLGGFAGGNNSSSQYMAIFSVLSVAAAGDPDYYSLIDFIQISSEGVSVVDSGNVTHTYDEKTAETVISVPFKKYDKDDARCCPSIKGSETYRIKAQQGQRIHVQ